MTSIVACLDGSMTATAVCDAGIWMSQRLNTPLKLLHVLDKSLNSPTTDLSGHIGFESRERLLEMLTALDEQRGAIALEHGKQLLAAAQQRVQQAAGVRRSSTLQRHGHLVETLRELEAETELFILGKQGQDHPDAPHAIGSQVEHAIRTVHKPVLVVLPHFTPPTQFMVAFDGSATAANMVEWIIAQHALFQELPGHLVMVGCPTAASQTSFELAHETLSAKGFIVHKAQLTGEVSSALQNYKTAHHIDLMVMGAYGHSRIRQFLVGSHTTHLLSLSDIPLLLLR